MTRRSTSEVRNEAPTNGRLRPIPRERPAGHLPQPPAAWTGPTSESRPAARSDERGTMTTERPHDESTRSTTGTSRTNVSAGAEPGFTTPGAAATTPDTASEGPPSPAGAPEVERLRAEVARLESELAEARRQADEYLAGLQRERAEFLNFKRRTAEEREAMLGLAAEALLSKVLALADDFDRAIETRPADLAEHPWVEGIVAIDRKLRALLESEGVRPIEAGPGTRFDPREHDAIMNVPSAGRVEGEIVEEIRRGYRLRDRILRPALVAVATSPDAGPTEPGSSGDPSAAGRSAETDPESGRGERPTTAPPAGDVSPPNEAGKSKE